MTALRRSLLAAFVVGLGSNVLAADEGVDALVMRLEGELAELSQEATAETDERLKEVYQEAIISKGRAAVK